MKSLQEYVLHFEACDGVTHHKGMAAVRQSIREAARNAGCTVAHATKLAYVMTREEYIKEQSEK